MEDMILMIDKGTWWGMAVLICFVVAVYAVRGM